MNKPILVVMAAGMGSRYGGLKQIDPVTDKGEIILDFSLYDAMIAGFSKVVFVIKEENEEAFRELMDGRAGKHMELCYAFQKLDDLPPGYQVPEGRVKPWGTAHAVYSARKYVDQPFAVINADDYYGPGAFGTLYDFLENVKDGDPAAGGRYHYAMVGYRLANTMTENGGVARGVCQVTEKGELSGVHERLQIQWRDGGAVCAADPGEPGDAGDGWLYLDPESTVSMNLWGFTPSILDAMEAGFPAFLDRALADNPLKGEYFLPGVVESLINDDKADVRVLRSQDRWFGVTYREDKPGVMAALQAMKDQGLYPDQLWK